MVNYINRSLFCVVFFFYLVLFVFVAYKFETDIVIEVLIYLIVNFLISAVFFAGVRRASEYPFFMIFYIVFWGAYVFKGVVQFYSGLDTLYALTTIRMTLSLLKYVSALEAVTYAHFVVVCILVFLSKLSISEVNVGSRVRVRVSDKVFWVFFLMAGGGVIASSIIMMSLGVAVMGTDGVSLPYKLSGVLFYARTILVPVLLLFFLQDAIEGGRRNIFRGCIFLFGLLAVSEILVRASKAPLFVLILQISMLYIILSCSGRSVVIRPSKTQLFFVFCLALLMWPAIEAYRVVMTKQIDVALDMSDYSDQNLVIYSLQRLFQRLLGFLQFAGIYSDRTMLHELNVIFSYDSLSRYYTQGYLGYFQKGHLSSPSLLGASFLLGGNYWLIVTGLFVIGSFTLWKLTEMTGMMANSMKAFLASGIFNVIMAGTVDFFIFDFCLLFIVSILLCYLFKAMTKSV